MARKDDKRKGRTMKKVHALIIILLLTYSLNACGGSDEEINVGDMFSVAASGKGAGNNANNGIAVRGRYKVDVWNLTIQNSAVAVLARDGASVSLTNVNFVGATATDRLIQVQTKGEVFLMGNSTVSGKASSFIYATDGAVEFFNPTVSLVNSPEITSFFNLRHSFATFGGSATFTGSSVGRKYYMVAGSILQTGGRGEVVIPGGSIASIKDASCFVV